MCAQLRSNIRRKQEVIRFHPNYKGQNCSCGFIKFPIVSRKKEKSTRYKMLKIILVDEKEDCITLHAVAEESFANIDMKCVFAEDKLTTAVTKIEDGYKLKYDVYQVNRKKKMKNFAANREFFRC